MVESTEREVVDIGMDTLMGIADIGWWIGSLSGTLVNVVSTAVTDEMYNSLVANGYSATRCDEVR